MTVKICGVPYRIEYCEENFSYDDHFGRIIYSEGVIRINKSCTEEMRKEVLYHEIVHGILWHTGQYNAHNDEPLVQALANAIYNMFELKTIEGEENADICQTDSTALDFVGNTPAIPADLTVPPTDEQKTYPLGRVRKLEFPFDGNYIWTDGTNMYYSNGPYHYALDKATLMWVPKMWNGLTEFHGDNIWTDGDNIYYSSGSDQYVLDKDTSTWDAKTWIDEEQTNISLFGGNYIWTDGTNIYYSFDMDNYVLDKDTSTWHKKTWNGLRRFFGRYIWTDGDNIYCSYHRIQYILDKKTSTWEINTWNDALYPFSKLIFRDADYIWTDGNKIYYSVGVEQYVLDKDTLTWYPKTWNGITLLRGDHIWTDGNNIYYSYNTDQYVLDKTTSTWVEKTWEELKLFSE